MHPFDRICIDVGRCHLDCCRKVDNRLVIWSWLPNIVNSVADLFGIFQLGTGVGLRAVLEEDGCTWNGCNQIETDLSTIGCDLLDTFFILPKDHTALQRGR